MLTQIAIYMSVFVTDAPPNPMFEFFPIPFIKLFITKYKVKKVVNMHEIKNYGIAIIGARNQSTDELMSDKLYTLVSEYNSIHHNGYNKAFVRYEYQDGELAGVSLDVPAAIVYNIPIADALDIAAQLNQKSLIYKDKSDLSLISVDGTTLADNVNWNSVKASGKGAHFVLSVYKGVPNSWKVKKIVGAGSAQLSTTYTKLFTVGIKEI